MANVNVRLKNRNLNVTAFGFKFDEDGICSGDKADFKSLLDAKKVFLVKDLKANKEEIKTLAGVDDDDSEDDNED
tara:strand:+ start:241 stop:465 length:225 start_codon:yes stop_codon:yes gene_type:complete